MKVQCQRSLLAAALQTVGAVVPARTPKEILKNMKLRIADGQAVLMGTDQEVGVRFELPEVESDAAGELLLPQRMSQILREVQDEAVTLETDGESLIVRAGHSEFQLTTEDPAEFPDVPALDEWLLTLPSRGFREAISRTILAVDDESTRYALGGVLMEVGEGKVVLAATDSRRLAVCDSTCTVSGDTEFPSQPVVPSKAMQLIERSLGGNEEVQLFLDANHVLARSGGTTVYSRLVEGRFPKWRDVIPPESKETIQLVAGPFHSAIRQAQIVTDQDSRGVDFTFGDGLLKLSSQATNVGASTIELPIDYSGEQIEITFDPKFVADFLKVLDPETQVVLKLIDSEQAAVFQVGENYTYVVMPLARDGG